MEFVIWSNDYLMWRAREGEYVQMFSEAGRFNEKAAREIIDEANAYVDRAGEPAAVAIGITRIMDWPDA